MNLSIFLITLSLVFQGIKSEDDANINEIASSPAPVDLDSNLRKALLRALNELENENDNPLETKEHDSERVIEKAHASSLTIFSNSGELDTSENPEQEFEETASSTVDPIIVPSTEVTEPENEKKTYVLLQSSQGVQEKTVTTFENEHTDLDGSNFEQILTSASNSFSPNNQQFGKAVQNEKISQENTNSIQSVEKTTARPDTTTVSTTTTTTDESAAKVENVQFFSAPLVAAFTVHQDEKGVPKKVEPIFKQISQDKQEFDEAKLKLKQQELQKQQEKIQQELQQEQIRLQRENIEKQNKLLNQEESRKQQEQLQRKNELYRQQQQLELEILRLNFHLKQQQELFLRQQEQLRLRGNAQPFLPIPNPGQVQNIQQLPTIQQPVIQQLPIRQQQQIPFLQTFPISQQLPVKPAQIFNNNNGFTNTVSLQPSITFDPLVENGKLPLNGQILPVRQAINFHTPLIQTPQFQQFHSITPALNNFNQLPLQQGNRFFRQESGVGNLLNKNSNSFSIQQSIQPPPVQNNLQRNPILSNELNTFRTVFPQQSNRFFRSNPESTFQAPQSNRFFRSNVEGTFGSPGNFNRQQSSNNQLNNLLFNAGAFRGRSSEDLNLVSKVLSYDNRFAGSNRQEQRIPYYRNV